MKDARIRRGKPAVASRFCKNISSSFISGSTPARAIQVHMHLIITYSCLSRSLRWPGPLKKDQREFQKFSGIAYEEMIRQKIAGDREEKNRQTM